MTHKRKLYQKNPNIVNMYNLHYILESIGSYSFFLKFLADTCPFLGPLVPLFWISGDVSSGFQSQSGFCLIRYFCGGECNVRSPRFTCGATLADLLAAGAQLVTSPHACAEVGLGNRTDRRRTRYHCASDPA